MLTRPQRGERGSNAPTHSASETLDAAIDQMPVVHRLVKGSDSGPLNAARKIISDRADHGFDKELSFVGADPFATIYANFEAWQRTLEYETRPTAMPEIIDMLADFADMLQVGVPREKGLQLYEAALDRLPRPCLDPIKLTLARTHRFARLPLPADFLNAGADLINAIHLLRTNAAGIRATLDKAQAARAERSRRRIDD